jgi:hypothetical protein
MKISGKLVVCLLALVFSAGLAFAIDDFNITVWDSYKIPIVGATIKSGMYPDAVTDANGKAVLSSSGDRDLRDLLKMLPGVPKDDKPLSVELLFIITKTGYYPKAQKVSIFNEAQLPYDLKVTLKPKSSYKPGTKVPTVPKTPTPPTILD